MIQTNDSKHTRPAPSERTILWSAPLLVLAFLCFALGPGQAVAADEVTFEYKPELSLVGNCDVTPVDEVPDPGCPGGLHPPSGHFKTPETVAVGAYGDEYVSVYGDETGQQGRIDVFDDEGAYITELPDPNGPIGAAVDEVGTLYVLEVAGFSDLELVRYDPESYDPESKDIQYDPASRVIIDSYVPTFEAGVTVDPATNRPFVLVGTGIQEYESVDELSSPEEKNLRLQGGGTQPVYGGISRYIAIDGQGRRLFRGFCKTGGSEDCIVQVREADFPYGLIGEIDGGDTPAGEFSAEWARVGLAVAVDETTGNVFVADLGPQAHRIFEFGPNYEYIATIDRPFLETPFFSQIAFSNSSLNPGAANKGYLFVPVKSRTGLQEVFAFKQVVKFPPAVEDLSVSRISETEGELRATVSANGAQTHYVITLEAEGSGANLVVGEGDLSPDSLSMRVNANLSGLQPGTAYRFEIVATNEKGEASEEGHFTTYSARPTAGSCPNDQNRLGLSAALPDCRAYELVTPANTSGRAPQGGGYAEYGLLRAAPGGDAVTFLTQGGPLPGTEGAGSYSGDRYRAVRGASGWFTQEAGPSGAESETPDAKMTSPDQGYGFWEALGNGSAVNGGFGNINGYLEYPDGHSERVGQGSLGTDPNAVGVFITANASHSVFRTVTNGSFGVFAKRLEPDAPAEGTEALYDRTPDGVTHVVSLLPGNETPAPGEAASLSGASADGEGIAFKIGTTLYFRFHNEATYEIGDDGQYAGISDGGRRLFYVKGGDLFAFEAETQNWITFTETGDATVVNVSPDGSRAYFVSPTAIGGAEENPLGALPKKGQENLYLSEEGHIRFVGKVTKSDVEGELQGSAETVHALGNWSTDAAGGMVPDVDASRVTPSGSSLLFESQGNLDGRNPTGARQIYRYDSVGNRLHCISCIPTGVPTGEGSTLQTFGSTSALAPEPLGPAIIVSNLSPDGRRAVFESKEALTAADNDGVQDIYEWEDEGVGSCTQAGGCLFLISSGSSATANYLYGVSRGGDDIFFVTEDTLVAGDATTSSIYDVRVGGGFPPPTSRGECAGEACQPTVVSPRIVAPASALFSGAGNVKAAPAKKCRRGTRKVRRHGKVRCVKKKNHRHAGKHRSRSGNSKKGAGK